MVNVQADFFDYVWELLYYVENRVKLLVDRGDNYKDMLDLINLTQWSSTLLK